MRNWLVNFVVLAGVAHADALDRVPEGASIYAELRPVALSGVLKKLGFDQLPAVQRIRQQAGGIDVFDPAILAPTGLDVASPIGLSMEFVSKSGLTHVRAAATLRDATMFRTFLAAVGSTAQVPVEVAKPGSPEEKVGIIAMASPTPTMKLVARLAGETLIIDGVDVWEGKPPAGVEIARSHPLDVVKPFQPGRGARRLFAGDTAAAFYVDGRRLTELFEAIYRQDLAEKLQAAKKAQRAAIKQRAMTKMKKCLADWSRAPATFDDLGVALSADPREARLTLAWGTQGEPALGGLRFTPLDDGGVDHEFLSRQAALVAALFAASSAPFTALKHTGIYTSMATVNEFGKRCGDEVNLGIALRGWPMVVAAGLSELNKPSAKQSTGLDLSAAMSAFGQLRNVVLVVRDAVSAQSAQFAIAATFDQPARTLLETLLAVFGGGGGTPKSLAPKRTPTVYSISNPNVGSFVGALENLPKGQVMFTFADSDESLQLAYRKATLMPGQDPSPRRTTPLAALHLDGGMVGRIFSNFGAAGSAKVAIDLMSRWKRVDADLAADGDLFRLVVRAPLKP